MFISTNQDNSSRVSMIYTMYYSLQDLWENRCKHQTLVLGIWLPGVRDSITELHKYCINNKKTLLVDVHDHYYGCISPPNIVNLTSSYMS